MTTLVVDLSDADVHRLNAIEVGWSLDSGEAIRRLIREQALHGSHSRLHGSVVALAPCEDAAWLIATFEDGSRMLVRARHTA